jgi:hypothetical protein
MSAQHPANTLSKGIIMTSLSTHKRRLKPALMACAASLSLFAAASLALAQDGGTTVDPRLLVEQLVTEGVITREQADRMIRNATVPVQQAQPPVPAGGVAADGTQTIPYVPEVVREQIVSQVRTELAGQAQAEGWARPGETPEWTRRIQLYGDVRVRGEGRFYEPPVFDDTGRQIGGNYAEFVDWGAINAGSGLQVNPAAPGFVNPPYLNTSEDRRRFRLRARLGVRAQIADWITADVRLGTGSDNAPVSTNQTLGLGGTGKYQLWLDRASIRLTPIRDVNIDFGRFANPFWTSDLIFDNDMNFDGVAVSASGRVSDQLTLFGTAGAFPVFNTDLNFGSRDIGAFESTDKYLFAAQVGVEFRPADGLRARLAGGYFYYDGVQGRTSSPCFWLQDVCDTDATRPSFQQFGNTIVPLRDVIPDPAALDTSPEVQYFGLASRFELVTARGQVEYDLSPRVGVRLEGDYVRNLGFDRSRVAALALNNFAPIIGTAGGQYAGGDTGWQGRLTVGALRMGLGQGDWSAERGDWSAHIGYRHLESDAVIDGFADSDFGSGGTNVKGWFAGANYGIARNSFLGVRWLSSEEIAGPQLSVDRLLIDLSTRF